MPKYKIIIAEELYYELEGEVEALDAHIAEEIGFDMWCKGEGKWTQTGNEHTYTEATLHNKIWEHLEHLGNRGGENDDKE